MKIKTLIKALQTLDGEQEIKVASDEEWNVIYSELFIQQDVDTKEWIIFGCGYDG